MNNGIFNSVVSVSEYEHLKWNQNRKLVLQSPGPMASLGPAPAGLAPSSDASAKALLVDWRNLKFLWLGKTGKNHGKPCT